MENNMVDKLKKWVEDNYIQCTTGWTYERSKGDYYDCFDDGETYGTSWAAWEVGQILGMDLEEPECVEDDEI